MPLNLAENAPPLPDVNDPNSYNQAVLDGFNFIFNILISRLDSLTPEEYFQVMASLTDATAGLLMKNGGHGLGGSAINIGSGDDYDDVPVTQFIGTSSGADAPANRPFSALFAGLNVRNTATQSFQILAPVSGGRGLQWRPKNITWSNWREIYDRENILGTVSQSGGVPTGAIIEEGSNANGHYVRYADGTQICTSPDWSLDITTATGSLYRNSSPQSWTFPAAFVGTSGVKAPLNY